MDIELRPSSEEIAEFIEEELSDCRIPPEDVNFLWPLLAIQIRSTATHPHPPLDGPAHIPNTVIEPPPEPSTTMSNSPAFLYLKAVGQPLPIPFSSSQRWHMAPPVPLEQQ
ncbi:hypothetical protein L210DRAFT_3656891 [Boletus edulis BED1]|uniref:Uncharacterized protein n=1 Tax=Boletus edulis BED1 TaxID=1328754 RepID=A0AAD4BBJ2_BOLED|nr:hypothetical protein L210DRAFT_3656891 [Boletus edulis BED1]